MAEEMEIDDSLYRYGEYNKKSWLICWFLMQSSALYAWRQCNEKNG